MSEVLPEKPKNENILLQLPESYKTNRQAPQTFEEPRDYDEIKTSRWINY